MVKLLNPNKKTYQDLKTNVVYTVQFKGKGNGQKIFTKSKIHGKTVIIKENNPKGNDIPSFEHGSVHIYDSKTNEYYGAFGIFYFASIVGFSV